LTPSSTHTKEREEKRREEFWSPEIKHHLICWYSISFCLLQWIYGIIPIWDSFDQF
jgi:hypothetical protein